MTPFDDQALPQTPRNTGRTKHSGTRMPDAPTAPDKSADAPGPGQAASAISAGDRLTHHRLEAYRRAWKHTLVRAQDLVDILVTRLKGELCFCWCAALRQGLNLPRPTRQEILAYEPEANLDERLASAERLAWLMALHGEEYLLVLDEEAWQEDGLTVDISKHVGVVNRSSLIHAIERRVAERGLTMEVFMDGQYDVEDADVILQYAAFGYEVYS